MTKKSSFSARDKIRWIVKYESEKALAPNKKLSYAKFCQKFCKESTDPKPTSLTEWIKKRDEIKKLVDSNDHRKKIKECYHPQVEEQLYKWFEHVKITNVLGPTITINMLIRKYQLVYDSLNPINPGLPENSSAKFKSTRKLVRGFCDRRSIRNRANYGEIGSSALELALNFQTKNCNPLPAVLFFSFYLCPLGSLVNCLKNLKIKNKTKRYY